MTDLIHADHLVSRCPECGSWQWRDWCNTCEQPTYVIREAS